MGNVKAGALDEREDDDTAGISDRVDNLKVVSGGPVGGGMTDAVHMPTPRRRRPRAAARKGEP